MKNTGTLKEGLIELVYGTLKINSLIAENIKIDSEPIIKATSTAGIMIINNGTFKDIERLDGNGAVIERVLSNDNDGVNIRGSSFNNCKVTGSDANGGAIYIKIESTSTSKFDII
jgi:hypothetical protein